MTTVHHKLTGLNVTEIPSHLEWGKSETTCNGITWPKTICWANSDDATLGVAAAVGRFIECEYPADLEGEVTEGNYTFKTEENRTFSMFTIQHQLFSELARRFTPGYRLRFTAKFEVPISEDEISHYAYCAPGQKGETVGVSGNIEFTVRIPDVNEERVTINFLNASHSLHSNGSSSENLDYRPVFFASVELDVPTNITTYGVEIAAKVKAYRSKGGSGYAEINLAGPGGGMRRNVVNGGAAIIVHYLKTELCQKLQKLAPPDTE